MKKYGLPQIKNPLITPKMKRPLDLKWEKEFEDYVQMHRGKIGNCFLYMGLRNKTMVNLVTKYLGGDESKVKIKVRKGCIQIERIGQ